MCTITIASLLMPLSWLVGIGNFCFNLFSSFLSIVCIFSSQSILFQIVLYAFFPQFPWSTVLPFPPFPSYLKLHVFGSWCLNRWHNHTIVHDFKLSYVGFSQQHWPYPEEHQSTLYWPVSPQASYWSYTTPPHATSPHLHQ